MPEQAHDVPEAVEWGQRLTKIGHETLKRVTEIIVRLKSEDDEIYQFGGVLLPFTPENDQIEVQNDDGITTISYDEGGDIAL